MRICTNTENDIQAAAQFDYKGYVISASTMSGLHEIGLIGPDKMFLPKSFPPNGESLKEAIAFVDALAMAAALRNVG